MEALEDPRKVYYRKIGIGSNLSNAPLSYPPELSSLHMFKIQIMIYKTFLCQQDARDLKCNTYCHCTLK